MKKKFKTSLLLLFMLIVTFFTFEVSAKVVGTNILANTSNCAGYFGSSSNPNDTAYWIQLALNVLRYAAIIVLIVMSSLDYIKAIVSQDSDALKKANTTFVKRLVYCIIIFLAPILVKFIMSFIGAYDNCGIN